MVDDAMAAFVRVHQAYISATEDEWANLELTVPQLRALFVIHRGDQTSVSQLARRLESRLSSTSVLVDRLVKAGMVSRTADASDRRRVLLDVTKEGSDLIERLRRGRVDLRTWLLALSPETLDGLVVGLRALAEVASGSVRFPYLDDDEPSPVPPEGARA